MKYLVLALLPPKGGDAPFLKIQRELSQLDKSPTPLVLPPIIPLGEMEKEVILRNFKKNLPPLEFLHITNRWKIIKSLDLYWNYVDIKLELDLGKWQNALGVKISALPWGHCGLLEGISLHRLDNPSFPSSLSLNRWDMAIIELQIEASPLVIKWTILNEIKLRSRSAQNLVDTSFFTQEPF